MNKKQERARKQRARTLRRTALIVGALAVALLVGWGGWAFVNSPIFEIDQVDVEGNNAVAAGDIRSVVAEGVDTTLFRVRSGALEESVSSLPWISTAEVSKRLPSTIGITVVERVPAATVTAPDGSVWLVSEDGYWLGALASSLTSTATVELAAAMVDEGGEGATIVDPAGGYPAVRYDPAGLVGIFDTPSPKPVAGKKVASAEVLNAVAVLQGLGAELAGQVERVTAPEVGSTSLIIESGVELVVGSADDIMVKSKVILSILKAHEGSVSLINVRSVNNPTWRGLDSE